jgi:hypothetical protein
MVTMTPQRTNDQILEDFKNKLGSHGIDVSRVDDNQWNNVLDDVRQLFISEKHNTDYASQ